MWITYNTREVFQEVFVSYCLCVTTHTHIIIFEERGRDEGIMKKKEDEEEDENYSYMNRRGIHICIVWSWCGCRIGVFHKQKFSQNAAYINVSASYYTHYFLAESLNVVLVMNIRTILYA